MNRMEKERARKKERKNKYTEERVEGRKTDRKY